MQIYPVSYQDFLEHDVYQTLVTTFGEERVAFVGGCVRDAVLGESSISDLDLVVLASAEAIQAAINKKCQIVMGNGKTLVRTGIFDIAPCEDFETDAHTRDFSINALYLGYNDGHQVIFDFRGGMADIEKRQLRVEYDKIEKDPVRLLRLFRFAAKYGFEIVQDKNYNFTNILEKLKLEPIERIQLEIEKSLLYRFHEFVGELYKSCPEVFAYIFPEFYGVQHIDGGRFHAETVWEHILDVSKAANKVIQPEGNFGHEASFGYQASEEMKKIFILSAFLHDIGKKECYNPVAHNFLMHESVGAELAKKWLERLKFSNLYIEKVPFLVENHMRVHKLKEMKPSTIRKFVAKIEKIGLDYDILLQLGACDTTGNRKKTEEALPQYETNASLMKQCLVLDARGKPKVERICVNGQDLKNIGFESGKHLGDTLRLLQNFVDERPELNTREQLLEIAQMDNPLEYFHDITDDNNDVCPG